MLPLSPRLGKQGKLTTMKIVKIENFDTKTKI
jgi:hypothetical protein